jgi:pyruvate/2-oxoglutarate dehydrogenase complex dihydrolipoamide dehydrogenase (E3) component
MVFMVFSIPSLASVGLQEKTAREQGLKFKTLYESAPQTGISHAVFMNPIRGLKCWLRKGAIAF